MLCFPLYLLLQNWMGCWSHRTPADSIIYAPDNNHINCIESQNDCFGYSTHTIFIITIIISSVKNLIDNRLTLIRFKSLCECVCSFREIAVLLIYFCCMLLLLLSADFGIWNAIDKLTLYAKYINMPCNWYNEYNIEIEIWYTHRQPYQIQKI